MEQIKIQPPQIVERVLNVLHEAGYEAYIVGGCVRDHLMGRTPGDYDVTTAALPEQTIAVFHKYAEDTGHYCRIVETGLKHGTVTIVMPQPDGEFYGVEVTTFRIDGEYTDNRHPKEVTFTLSLAKDMARRDFTINAMAYSEEDGVIDLYEGQEDLANRTIRCVGEARRRFQEDGLRILRAMRFAAVLDFTPCDTDGAPYVPDAAKNTTNDSSPSTHAAIHQMQDLLCGISRERIYMELTKLLCGVAADRILRTYPDVIMTALPMLQSPEQIRIAADAIQRLLEGERATGVRLSPEGRYALLFADCTEEEMQEAVASLKMSRVNRKQVIRFWEHRDLLPQTTEDPQYTWRTMAGCMQNYGKRRFDFCREQALFLYARAQITAEVRDRMLTAIEELEAKDPCCTLADLAVNGMDIKGIGITKATVGIALSALLEEVLHERLPNDKEVLLGRAKALQGIALVPTPGKKRRNKKKKKPVTQDNGESHDE